MKPAILATAIAAVTTLTADAALITWGAAQNITGDSDVSLNGTLVEAVNFGAANNATTTVNGVTFTEFDPLLPTISPTFSIAGVTFVAGNNPGPVSLAYGRLLYEGPNGAPMTLTLSGLVVGDVYEFQFWSNLSLPFAGRTLTATTGATSVTLDSNVTDQNQGLGQFAIGTFVADSISQVITFSTVSFGPLNGAQLRNLGPASVPEPGTALAGVMLAGLLGMRRRRN